MEPFSFVTVLLGIIFFQESTVSHAKRIPTYAGPYKAIVQKFYRCEPHDPKETIIAYLHLYPIVHPRELQKVSGNVSISSFYDDNSWVRVKLDLWNSNQWKENAFIFKFPRKGCSALRSNIPDIFRVLYRKDPYSSEPCILSPAAYIVPKQPINWTFPNFPVMPYGKYRVTLLLGTGKEKFFCTVAESVIAPLV